MSDTNKVEPNESSGSANGAASSADASAKPPPAQARAGGLDGVVVADTLLSEVDGERGHLLLAGYDLETLSSDGGTTFEDLCGLLWTGTLPRPEGRDSLREALAAGRVEAFARLDRLGDALAADDGMDALRAAMAHLGGDVAPAVLAGAAATFAAAWARRREGHAPVAPDPSLRQAEDMLRMVRGAPPSDAEARALDTYLVTVSDHGMNASTFTARVVTSTGSDRVSAVVAAIGALKGPLHGGAPGPVLDMLDAVGSADRAAAWVDGELTAGRRIMGMGHRIYRVRDPRAAVLERAVERLFREARGGAAARLELSRAVEQAAEKALAARHPDRPLRANVEFYTAVLLEAVGLPRALFSPTFAVGRIAGWCAHVEEQRRTGRLIRPNSRYVGPRPATS
ncbi:citrate synthase [Chondromyces apiculatus]|uniref:Citrate synthase n=1 Tax=Chondromyces apiculatus DSM 436 TaxID=1192034 RepID=A0A017SYB5_9BACT|nr:citrate synthase [Chondromyces apiculatus]EYF01767.1 Citrate synthase (si) [Chondromyces apiculatus DSM 436]